VNPRPSDGEVSEAARTGLHQGESAFERIGEFDERKIATYLHVLERIFRGRTDLGPRWLDIGCGHGEFLVALQRYAALNETLLGIEPSKPKRESALGRGLHVEDETFRGEPAAFDGLSLLNVYSHLPDPVHALKQWAQWLKPGGQLLLQTGDSCHLPLRYHHKPFELPDHLSFSNERLLRRLLERVGFRVARCVRLRHGAYPGWQFWKHPYRDLWLLAERR
jgi:SAM-dependent methyltransferase